MVTHGRWTRTARARIARAVFVGSLAVLLAGGAAVGCAPQQAAEEPEPQRPPAVEPEPATMEVTLYFTRGETLGVAAREVDWTREVARVAMEQLLAGPGEADREAGLGTEVPEGTRLNGVSITDGVATVDLSSEFEAGGGSLSMQLRVAQVVYTLTRFETVTSVAFEIDGRPVEAIGGEGVVVSPPVTRTDFADAALPAILVESPAPWQAVSSPLRLTGMSNTFEATLNYQLVDAVGANIADGYATATAGTGTWGTFDVTIPFEVTRAGAGRLVVFEVSAKDGSRINAVEIPLDLE
ncbi:MAG TPA: GerMN domain-containing protein [Coriobacteriia bacterium]|nr:GerMN domain-containing protein [Coriobacteriia bacterium]